MFDFSAEMIVNAAIKAIGMDPAKTRAQVIHLQQWVIDGMKNLDSRVKAMESDRAGMHAKLDRLINLLEQQNDGRNEQHAISGGTDSIRIVDSFHGRNGSGHRTADSGSGE